MEKKAKVKLIKSYVNVKIVGFNKWRVNKYQGELLEDSAEMHLRRGDHFLFRPDMIKFMEE